VRRFYVDLALEKATRRFSSLFLVVLVATWTSSLYPVKKTGASGQAATGCTKKFFLSANENAYSGV
jgi:hypothetical protein